MKVMDIIDRVDTMEPNDYAPEQKIHWLSTLDGKIYREVLRTHEGCSAWGGPYQTGQEQLLIGEPYGEDIYYFYLQAMIASETRETQLYNKRMTQFNSAYQGWTNMYNRTHAPTSVRENRFKF